MSVAPNTRLGRGLGALLGDHLDRPVEGEVARLLLDSVGPNPFQPRREFKEEEIRELAASISANGLLQPVLVRSAPEPEHWELVAGERRLRAVTRLGWSDVPAIVREVDDETMLVLALVENLQRRNLGALEEAEGYKVLVEKFKRTQEDIALAVGKSRATVTNILRLLKLPVEVRQLLGEEKLTPGHGRALLAVDDQEWAAELARMVVEGGWSVRRLEETVRTNPTRPPGNEDAPDHRKRRARQSRALDPVLRALQEELRAALGTRVVVRRQRGSKGRIEIPFHDDRDLERVFALVSGREAADVLE
ncbi:MAG: ParB/RepB/Spo0J family partition protein [Gammaproteobacteria bacterium]|nr:ParB/RepB/Spo0J family partition protein [Gammaproteobacteria bacterium]